MSVELDGNNLSLEEIWKISCEQEQIKLSPEAENRVVRCRQYVEDIISQNKTVYGLTTGFGKFSNIKIPIDQIEELQENLILSHATGVGPWLSIPETRSIMLLRINVLAKGYSGIRLETLQLLIDLLNKSVHPCIPEKGSVGA
ncbi:MAG: aromatic amino acid lyase, partial [Candidatus Cloacimonetes bacterium]|nr:aromatic amino acid lyase [Candidatus Cloacimonadota bacterium]